MRRKSKVHYWVCVGCVIKYRAKTKKGAVRAFIKLAHKLSGTKHAQITYDKWSFSKGHRSMRTYYAK